MTRQRVLTVVTALAFATIAIATAACDSTSTATPTATKSSNATPTTATAASERAATTGTKVHLVLDRGPNTMAPPTCIDQSCVYSFGNAPIQVSGDMVGVAVSVGAGAPMPDGGYAGAGYSLFTGTVPMCGGDGTVAWIDHAVSSADGHVDTTWTIVEGSGTGSLAHLHGGGTGGAGSKIAADGSGTGIGEGSLDCG